MPNIINVDEAQKRTKEFRKVLRKYRVEKDKLEAKIRFRQQVRKEKERGWVKQQAIIEQNLENALRPLSMKLADLQKEQLALKKEAKRDILNRTEQQELRTQQTKRLSVQQALRKARQMFSQSQRQQKDLLSAIAQLQGKLRNLEISFPRQWATLERKEKNNPIARQLQGLDRSLSRLVPLKQLNQKAEARVSRQIATCSEGRAKQRLEMELTRIQRETRDQQRTIENSQKEKSRLAKILKKSTEAIRTEMNNLERQHKRDLEEGRNKLSQLQTQLAKLKQKMGEQERLITKLREEDGNLGRAVATQEKMRLNRERNTEKIIQAQRKIATEIKLTQQAEKRLRREAADRLKRLESQRQRLIQATEKEIANTQKRISQVDQKINHLKIEMAKALDLFWQAVHQDLKHEKKN